MTVLVVDASVALKWFVSESDSDRSAALLGAAFILLMPAHFRSELANAFDSKVRRKELAPGDAVERQPPVSKRCH